MAVAHPTWMLTDTSSSRAGSKYDTESLLVNTAVNQALDKVEAKGLGRSLCGAGAVVVEAQRSQLKVSKNLGET